MHHDIHPLKCLNHCLFHNNVIVKNEKSFLLLLLNSSFFSLEKERIETNEDNVLYKEIILRQHAVPLGDLLQTTES